MQRDRQKRPTAPASRPGQDNINHPSHYTHGGIECIDIIGAVAGSYEGEAAVCVGNVVKYLYRANFKNGLEDLKKAKWYLDRLVTRCTGEDEE